MLIAGLMSAAALMAAAQQPVATDGTTGATRPHAQEALADSGSPAPQAMPPFEAPVEFQSVKVAYSPTADVFVAVDSVECSIHLVTKMKKKVGGGDSLGTVASYQTDNTHKRHDLKNILRPVSVGFLGDKVLLLASAVNDSAYVALLDMKLDTLVRYNFRSPMYAMRVEQDRLIVVGRNPYGYDVNILPLGGEKGFQSDKVLTHHYRVAKQAEKIKHSDPLGVGLTAVAVAVVFLALVFIALILQGTGRLMMGAEERKKNKAPKDKKGGIKPVSEGSSASASAEEEVYAAIAAAIHLYSDELHDEESSVITIQKVEREWTPWNAKYYNMNHYFNNNKR